ncbi:MAG: FadR family transcriptional regulator [Solirubrobacteraceae bacterium]|nr:FadR family transcriptional regulator [Solirubrobacteraceae bacterium]
MPSDQTTAAAPQFSAVAREERLSDKVAGALTESILGGALEIGAKLPSERALCEQFEVSRPVVREAVRSLIAKGLLAEHPRRGHVIAAVQPESVSQSLMLYIRGRPLDYGKIAEIRRVIEVETAMRAAERADADQIAAVLAAADALKDRMAAAEAADVDIAFHRAIAVATGNEFFVILVDSLRDVLFDAQLPTLAKPAIRKTARAAHQKIAAAIERKDPQAAGDAMRAHLDLAQDQMRDLMRDAGEITVD